MSSLDPADDNLYRCFGNKPGQVEYAAYHDDEWGIPCHDDQHLFEMLVLEGTQAGLSWETVLKKRRAYRLAFYNFDPQRVADMTDDELEGCLKNSGLIRNRLKIYMARRNAQVFLNIQKEWGSFDRYLWSFVTDAPRVNNPENETDIPVETEESRALSKDLKKRGMQFVGPVIMYAYMQAVGLVNDHTQKCWKNKENEVS